MSSELAKFGVGELDSIVLKASTTTTIRLTAEAVLLPRTFVVAFFGRQFLDRELLATGLRATAEILRPHGPSMCLAETLLSYVRCTRGDSPSGQAIELVVEAITMLRGVDAQHRLGRAYLEFGATLKAAGVPYDALVALDHAVQLGEQHRDPGLLLAAHYERGTIYRRLGLPISARDAFAASRQFAAPSDVAPEWLERLFSEEAACDVAIGRDAEAEDILAAWIKGGTSTHRPYLMRGDLRAKTGGPAAALEDYVEGCLLAGQTIRAAASDRFRRSDARQADEIFQAGIAAAVATGASATAFGLAELFLAGPAAYEADLGPDATDSASVSKARLEGLISTARKASESRNRQDLATCHEEAEWLLGQADVLLRRRRAETPITRETLKDWSERVQTSLPAHTALLEYVEAGGQIIGFCLTRDHVCALETGLSSLEAALLAQSAHHEIQGRFSTDALRQLGGRLLDPFAETLQHFGAVLIVPSRELAGVSFAAMPLKRDPLITTHSVGYALSGRQIVEARPQGGGVAPDWHWQGIGCAEPGYAAAQPLAFVQSELDSVARQFDAPSLKFGAEASADALMGALDQSDILHLACHGAFASDAPLLSYLLLADRPVFAFELLLRRRAPKFVVLSACETARARAELGGHMQSLAAAFLASGAGAVVGAFWLLDDEAAAGLMEEMYKTLMESARSVPEALAVAQREIRRDHPHPYYWASLGAFSNGARA